MLTNLVKRKSQTQVSQEPQEKRLTMQQPSAHQCLAVLPGIHDLWSVD